MNQKVKEHISSIVAKRRYKIQLKHEGNWATIVNDLNSEEADQVLGEYQRFFKGDKFQIETQG